MTFVTKTLSLGVALVSLAGCASSVKLDDAAPVVDAKASSAGGGAAGAGAKGATTAQSAVATVDASKIDPAAAGNLGRVVYFDYDSYVLKDEFRPLVEGYARVLSSARTKKMVIEGHTDERGGREYNLALGQRRAEAVARSLMLLGVADAQVEAPNASSRQRIRYSDACPRFPSSPTVVQVSRTCPSPWTSTTRSVTGPGGMVSGGGGGTSVLSVAVLLRALQFPELSCDRIRNANGVPDANPETVTWTEDPGDAGLRGTWVAPLQDPEGNVDPAR